MRNELQHRYYTNFLGELTPVKRFAAINFVGSPTYFNMNQDTIIKRADGSQIKIRIWLYIDSRSTSFTWQVETKEKGKKLWKQVHSTDDYKWRGLDMDGRLKYQNELYLQHVTKEEVYAAMNELISKIELPKL